MPFKDAELARLTDEVRATFGATAWNDARDRAFVVARQRLVADDFSESFDGDAATYDALKTELRRLLHRH